MKSNLTTLCYLEQDDTYLMLYRNKKENDINEGKWIGVGGHFEKGESPEECLLREVKEETGLTLTAFTFRGIVTFEALGELTEYMCLYVATAWEGELTTCDEGELHWVAKDKLLTKNLWQGDRVFLHLLRQDGPFFSLKLTYQGDRLVGCQRDGKCMELLDVRDWDGKLTGEVIPRFIAHETGVIHGTVHIWVVRPNGNTFDVLLQKRCQDKDAFPGCWDISSAGHIPSGEEVTIGAVRELAEELGIHAKPEELHDIGVHKTKEDTTFYNRPFRNFEVSRVFLYQEPVDIKNLTLQKEEVEAVRWMEINKLKQMVAENGMKHCIPLEELLRLERGYYKLPK